MSYYRNGIFQKGFVRLGARCLVVIGLMACAAYGFLPEPPGEANGAEHSAEASCEAEAPPCEPTQEDARQSTAATGEFSEPAVGVITSEFGERLGRRHTGIDIGGDMGSEILAADGGRVAFSGWMDGYGNYIVLDHENGYQTAYGHCDQRLAHEGERVYRGQVIATMGSTGNSTGPHLHFEIKYNDEFQNPLAYVAYSEKN